MVRISVLCCYPELLKLLKELSAVFPPCFDSPNRLSALVLLFGSPKVSSHLLRKSTVFPQFGGVCPIIASTKLAANLSGRPPMKKLRRKQIADSCEANSASYVF